MLRFLLKILKNKWFHRVMALFLVVFALYLFNLNQIITTRFEARRWNLPSRIYSDAYSLYPKRTIKLSELKNRLTYLKYRPVNRPVKQHGEYAVFNSSHSVQIFLHNFDYPKKNFKGRPVQIYFAGSQISRITNLDTNENLPLVQLEPELLASVFDENMENRTFVKLSEIPRIVSDAVITIEDERFYSHAGFDPIGIARAILTNILKRRFAQGGSTLTQQLVKNFFLTHERTLKRKINELFMSIILDLRYSKDEILEVYLNEIYFGQRGAESITGVQEAARFYFSKDVQDLSNSQAALLAGIIRGPGVYSPFRNPKKSKSRRNLILKKLFEKDLLSKTEYQDALKEALPSPSQKAKKTSIRFFLDFVQKQIKEDFPRDVLEAEGLRVFTTLDPYQQRLATQTLQNWLTKLEQNRGLLKRNKKKGLELDGAFVSLQPQTGFIRSYVGGRDYQKSQFDILNLSKRQPGSTFKPFVYLTGLDGRVTEPPFTLASRLIDDPVEYPSAGENWTPKNYDKEYHGEVSFREALEKSYNASTVWLAHQIGLNEVISTAKLVGIGSNLKPFPSMPLGAFEVRPLDLAYAYSVFANQGSLSKPISVRRVVTPKGEVLEKKSLELKNVFDPKVIYLMNKLMEGVFVDGTAKSAGAYGFSGRAAGKTGTTSDYRDAWFVGYTPDLLALTWVGYQNNQTTGLSGSSGALPIWAQFMKDASQTSKDFFVPEDIVLVPVDEKTGLLYRSFCSTMREEYFIDGTEPKRYCR